MQHPRDVAKEGGRPEVTNAAGVEPDAARAELARILASAEFDASERNRRFLSYIVEQTLGGRGDRIKAYDIAVTVFGRDDGFDPQIDPIVRIEASRLRRSLDHYYLLAGRDDPIRIEIPKGGYVPVFHQGDDAMLARLEPSAAPLERSDIPPRRFQRRLRLEKPRALLVGLAVLGVIGLGSALATLWLDPPASPSDGTGDVADLQGPSILVAPFDDDSGEGRHPALSRGFTREVIAGLTRFSELFVFGPATTFQQSGAVDVQTMAAEVGVDFILSGGVSASADRFHVTASLIDAMSGRHLWSAKFAGQLAADQVITVRDELADQVVRALGQPYGALFIYETDEIQGKSPQNFTSYECVLHFHQYWRRYDAQLYGSVRECLERAIVEDPVYADAFASLAMIYADAHRFRLDRGTIGVDPLPRALELAHRAVDLAPHSTHAHHALHLVHWLMNDVERSLEVGERGLALNPNDSELMAELGLRYCLRARWDQGLPLVQRAYARNPAQSGQYRIALFLHHYINGRYEESLAQAEKIDVQSVIYAHITQAMAYAQLGRAEEAGAAVGEILAIDPAYGEHAIADLEKRNLHPDLIRAVVDGLEAAGLPVKGSSSAAAS